jgi:hypothetical protein
MRECVFCPNTDLTVEHVFGKKLVAEFAPGPKLHSQMALRKEVDAPFERMAWGRQSGKGGGLEVKTVCGSCNHGWMQDLDAVAKPLLWELAHVKTGTLQFPDGNHLLAQWVTKIALVMDSTVIPMRVPKETRWKFREDREPIHTTTVWIGAMERVAHEFRQLGISLGRAEPRNDNQVYVATFRILHVVFQVVIPLDDRVTIVRRDGFEQVVRRLWPPEGTIDWPPPRRVWLPTERSFDALAGAFVAQREPGGSS